MTRVKLWYSSYSGLWRVLALCVIFITNSLTHGKKCVQKGPCQCEFDDGSGTVDLTPLAKQDGTAMMQDQFAKDNYAYSFNPCIPFTEGTCKNAAACQIDTKGPVYYNIGDAAKVTLSYDGNDLIGTYIADDGARTSKVKFKCDPNAEQPSDVADGETSTMNYQFTVTSKYCCPVKDGPGPGPGPEPHVEVSLSISVGSVLLIVFVVILAVYLLAGILFNKFARNNTGRELVPNVSLWIAMPGLIKDGCLFLVGKVTRRGGYQKA